jgi:hypothetical protein
LSETLYTEDIRRFIFTRNWPSGLVMDIAEADEPSPHLNLIFFRDNWLTLTFEEQQITTTIVKEVMDKVWNMGIPIYVGKMESRYES